MKPSIPFRYLYQRCHKAVREAKGSSDWCLSVFVDNPGASASMTTTTSSLGGEHTFAFGPRSLRRSSDGHRGGQPGSLRYRKGGQAHLQHGRLLLCPAHLRSAPAQAYPPPPAHLRRRPEGVEHGGNKSGIPTINGCNVFDRTLSGKPWSIAGQEGSCRPVSTDRKPTPKRSGPGTSSS
jgi:phosphoribosylformylglycinamidine synthase